MDAWQESWDSFVESLAEHFRSRGTAAELAKRFGGRVVRWSGVLDLKDLDGSAPSVEISFPEKQLELEDGHSTTLYGLALPVDKLTVADWKSKHVGAQVTFTATFVSEMSPFPAIEVVHLENGPSILMIRVSGGKLE